jgi:hypothetical protein
MSIFRRRPGAVRASGWRKRSGRRPVGCPLAGPLVLEERTLLSNVLTVTNANDGGNGSLRAEVAAARSGDTIVFSPTVFGRTITLTSGPIVDAGRDLTILGPGAGLLTVDGDHRSGIFSLGTSALAGSPIRVAISGLTLAHGGGDAGIPPPAAIEDTDASLVLEGDRFVDNGSGAVRVTKSVSYTPPDFNVAVTVIGNEFRNNRTEFLGGGAISVFGVHLDVEGSLFSGNDGPSDGLSDGGALYLGNTRTTVTTSVITGSLFVGNTAGTSGGAIWNQGGPLTIGSSAFSGNRAPDGGAVEASWLGADFAFPVPTGSLTISGSYFINNEAVSAVTPVYPGTAGGALDATNASGPIRISTCLFEGNRADGGVGTSPGQLVLGGAVHISGYAGVAMDPPFFPPYPPVSIDSTAFIDNQANGGHGGAGGYAGGGALAVQDAGTISVSHSIFNDNSARADSGSPGDHGYQIFQAAGGAIYSIAPLIISGSSFGGNAAIGGDGGNGGVGGTASGGAIYNYENLTITGSTLTGNKAVGGNGVAGADGGMSLGGAITSDFYTTMTATGDEFVGNLAVGGNAGAGSGTGGQAVGGGIFTGGIATISSSLFSDDRAVGGSGGNGGASGAGGVGGEADGGGIGSGLIGVPSYFPIALTVTGDLFVGDRADGGEGGPGTTEGADGQGLGGGIAILAGTAGIQKAKYAGNEASTAGDDVYFA